MDVASCLENNEKCYCAFGVPPDFFALAVAPKRFARTYSIHVGYIHRTHMKYSTREPNAKANAGAADRFMLACPICLCSTGNI